jgi:hypothetical protein
MIFVTAMAIGTLVGLQRSMVAVILVATMIGFAYLAAVAVSFGHVPLLAFLAAVAGYNAALIGHVLIGLALHRPRHA